MHTASTAAAPQSNAPRPTTKTSAARGIVLDLIQSVLLPLVCFRVARTSLGLGEVPALLWSSAYPAARAALQLSRERRLGPTNLLVLLGLLLSAAVVALGGTPKVLLVRESLLTLVVGLACFASLLWARRPLMFYFGREMWAGNDPEKRACFERSAAQEPWRGMHRRITSVWGVVLVAEFCTKVAVVWWCSTGVAMGVGSAVFYTVSAATMGWTMRYVGRVRRAAGV